MERVKTLVESLKEGYEKAFDYLDKKVNEIGDIYIKDVKDTVYPIGSSLDKNDLGYIERIVIYKEKKITEESEGEPWKPTLDIDLREFIIYTKPPAKIKNWLEASYESGITTMREFLALPYEWFESKSNQSPLIGAKWADEPHLYIGNKLWEKMTSFFEKYGYKLKKEGNVIED